MEYTHARQGGQPSREGTPGNFSGLVMMDALLADGDGESATVRVNNVFFTPGGRTYWHGAAPDAFMNHTAVSLGVTRWLEEVSAGDYEAAFKYE